MGHPVEHHGTHRQLPGIGLAAALGLDDPGQPIEIVRGIGGDVVPGAVQGDPAVFIGDAPPGGGGQRPEGNVGPPIADIAGPGEGLPGRAVPGAVAPGEEVGADCPGNAGRPPAAVPGDGAPQTVAKGPEGDIGHPVFQAGGEGKDLPVQGHRGLLGPEGEDHGQGQRGTGYPTEKGSLHLAAPRFRRFFPSYRWGRAVTSGKAFHLAKWLRSGNKKDPRKGRPPSPSGDFSAKSGLVGFSSQTKGKFSFFQREAAFFRAARSEHSSARGQVSHLGLRAVQMSRPKWTKRWHNGACSAGSTTFFSAISTA